MTDIITDFTEIKRVAADKEIENENFQDFIKTQEGASTDAIVHELDRQISERIDCTACGNCCRSLMINISPEEITALADTVQMSVAETKQKYVEESSGGIMIINTIPCHFLNNNCCTIYEKRFTDCRDFPHLSKKNFKERLFSTMMYYSMCPIIFNVIETLKIELGFIIADSPKDFPTAVQ